MASFSPDLEESYVVKSAPEIFSDNLTFKSLTRKCLSWLMVFCLTDAGFWQKRLFTNILWKIQSAITLLRTKKSTG